jgi:uncharacterized protein (DUF305 family)
VPSPLDFRPSRRLAVAAVVAVVVLALAFTAGWFTPRLLAPGDASPEAGFARDMSTHHRQAVEMGFIAYAHATNAAVRTIGYDIATSQQYQVGEMEEWLNQWGLTPTSTHAPMSWMAASERQLQPDGRMPGYASDAEMQQLRTATGKNVDVLFCQLMIRHHLGGIHMTEEILKLSHNRRVLELATAMKNGQQSDIAALQQLLSEMGATAR